LASPREFKKISVDINTLRGEDVAKAHTYINQMAQVMKNLTDEGLAFTSEIRKTKRAIGVDLYVAADKATAAMRGLEHVRAKVVASSATDDSPGVDPFRKFKKSDVSMLEQERTILGNKREIAAIRANVMKHGGTLTEGEEQDQYKLRIPVTAWKDKKNASKAESFDLVRDITMSIDAQNSKVQAKENSKKEKEAEKIKQQEEKKREQSAAQEEKESQMFAIKALAGVAIIIKVLHILADFAKKIFEAIGVFAAKATANARTGWSVGMSAAQIYEYGRAEQRRSLPEGTVLGAVETIQKQFGDLENLDGNAIKKIGVALGEDVADFISTGLGNGEKPLDLLEKLLGGYLDLAMSGKHVLTKGYVGPEDAIRAAITHLGGFNENAAKILAAMFQSAMQTKDPQDKASALSGFQSWALSGSPAAVNAGGITNAENSFMTGIDLLLKDIKVVLDGIKDGIVVKLANLLKDVMGGVRNALRIGMSDEMRYADIQAAKESNAIKIEQAEKVSQAILKTENDQRIRMMMLMPSVPIAEMNAAAESLHRGEVPASVGVLNALTRDPTLIPMLQSYGTTIAQKKAVLNYMNAGKAFQLRNDTPWMVSDPLSVMQMESTNARSLSASSLQAAVSSAGAWVKPELRTGKEAATLQAVQAFQRAVTSRWGLNQNAFAMGPMTAEAARKSADTTLSYYLADELHREAAAVNTTGRMSSATEVNVAFKDQTIVLELRDEKTKNVIMKKTVANEGFSVSGSHTVNVGRTNANVVTREPVATPDERPDYDYSGPTKDSRVIPTVPLNTEVLSWQEEQRAQAQQQLDLDAAKRAERLAEEATFIKLGVQIPAPLRF
jgi:hypothetical protein